MEGSGENLDRTYGLYLQSVITQVTPLLPAGGGLASHKAVEVEEEGDSEADDEEVGVEAVVEGIIGTTPESAITGAVEATGAVELERLLCGALNDLCGVSPDVAAAHTVTLSSAGSAGTSETSSSGGSSKVSTGIVAKGLGGKILPAPQLPPTSSTPEVSIAEEVKRIDRICQLVGLIMTHSAVWDESSEIKNRSINRGQTREHEKSEK
jgi:hypothetical protein